MHTYNTLIQFIGLGGATSAIQDVIFILLWLVFQNVVWINKVHNGKLRILLRQGRFFMLTSL